LNDLPENFAANLRDEVGNQVKPSRTALSFANEEAGEKRAGRDTLAE
jgi:hypothetical protein